MHAGTIVCKVYGYYDTLGYQLLFEQTKDF